MAEEKTVNQEIKPGGTGAEPKGERTFTQSELNAIVTDRLSRAQEQYKDYAALKEKAEKYDAAQEAGKTQLQKATERAEALQKQVEAFTKAEALRGIREKVSKETGVPASLLFGEDEATCKAQAEAIAAYAKPAAGTGTVIRDGGDHGAKGAGAGGQSDGVMAAFAKMNPNLKI